MDEDPKDIDNAIDTATRRVGQAEHEFVEEPPESPDLVPKARRVEHRAQDLHALASDAATGPENEDEGPEVP